MPLQLELWRTRVYLRVLLKESFYEEIESPPKRFGGKNTGWTQGHQRLKVKNIGSNNLFITTIVCPLYVVYLPNKRLKILLKIVSCKWKIVS